MKIEELLAKIHEDLYVISVALREIADRVKK